MIYDFFSLANKSSYGTLLCKKSYDTCIFLVQLELSFRLANLKPYIKERKSEPNLNTAMN